MRSEYIRLYSSIYLERDMDGEEYESVTGFYD
jgi:hypothetical protein